MCFYVYPNHSHGSTCSVYVSFIVLKKANRQYKNWSTFLCISVMIKNRFYLSGSQRHLPYTTVLPTMTQNLDRSHCDVNVSDNESKP